MRQLPSKERTDVLSKMNHYELSLAGWNTLFNSLEDIITLQGPDFSIIKANKAAMEAFRSYTDNPLGKRCYEIFSGIDKPCRNCPLEATIDDGTEHTATIYHEKIQRVFRVTSSFIPAADTDQKYLLHIAKDITDKVRKEKKLWESDDRFTKAFLSSPAPMIISDIESGVILDVNDRCLQMTEYAKDELIGKTSSNLHLWENHEDRSRIVDQLNTAGAVHDYSASILTKSGELRSTLWSAEKITLNGKEMMLSQVNDITDHIRAINSLKESKDKFEQAFESSPDAICISRLDNSTLVNINKGFTQLTGYGWEEVRGKTTIELGLWRNPEDHARFLNMLKNQKYCENLEVTFLTKNNEHRVGLISGRVLMFNGVMHVISITRDITHFRKIEDEIARQKMIFEFMFDAIIDGVVITDTERRIVKTNSAIQTIFGYTPEELQGKQTTVLYADADQYSKAGKTVFNKDSGTDNSHYISTYRMKNGQEFPGETLGVKLFDHKKRWVGNLGIVRDVSERMKKEQALERLEAAIEQTLDTIIITDQTGTIQYVNPAFERITGYTRKEVIGSNPRILKSGKHNTEFYQNLWDTLAQGKTFQGRIVNKKKDGTLFTEEASISPILDGNRSIVSYVAVKRDITYQLRLEAQYMQAQKMEAVGRLTGGVAHDFNNILGVIIGYAEISLGEIDSSHQFHDALSRIRDAGDRSAAIVRQLLAFSRKQTISPKTFDLNSGVEDMLKMIHRLIGENISISWIPGPSPLLVKMDPAQLDQILANLCINAKDAINGIGRITIESAQHTIDEEYCKDHVGFQPGKYIQLIVSDNGTGIKKEDQDKVFEPFFTTKELGFGTGLGLSTVYGIMKQNQGFINLYSEPGTGTTITLFFPIVATSAQQDVIPENTTMVSTDNNELVLVVEDDFSLLTMTRKMLEKQGYTVLTASDPSAALELARQTRSPIDLLITDVVMPEMNGRELALAFHDIFPDMKIIFMSGYTSNVIVRDNILDNGVNFIQKPFTRAHLITTVSRVLGEG